MCEYSGKLIAWLDGELPELEAANVGCHVSQCTACRRAAGAYAEVSGAFLACYESTMTVRRPGRASIWTLGGMAAAAAMLASILLALPRTEKLSILIPAPPPAPAAAFARPPEPVVHARAVRHPASPLVRSPVRSPWMAVEPMVEVALPADALFPPGAVPEGFSFIADVRP